mmetsp:Transcript_32297/g.82233  ORF Transcript_32297/g.82233 Transcript_32297/m.82233 type:complete len:264 (-) Transcript_32297:3-794(-)
MLKVHLQDTHSRTQACQREVRCSPRCLPVDRVLQHPEAGEVHPAPLPGSHGIREIWHLNQRRVLTSPCWDHDATLLQEPITRVGHEVDGALAQEHCAEGLGDKDIGTPLTGHLLQVHLRGQRCNHGDVGTRKVVFPVGFDRLFGKRCEGRIRLYRKDVGSTQVCRHHRQEATACTNIKHRAVSTALWDDSPECTPIEVVAPHVVEHDVVVIVLEEGLLLGAKHTAGDDEKANKHRKCLCHRPQTSMPPNHPIMGAAMTLENRS